LWVLARWRGSKLAKGVGGVGFEVPQKRGTWHEKHWGQGLESAGRDARATAGWEAGAT